MLLYVFDWPKTESILFGTKHKLKKSNTIKVQCEGNIIESKSSVKYLGVSLDQSVSGEEIAATILSKTAKKLNFLYRYTHFFNIKVKKLLVASLIQCHFDYACSAWYSGLSQKLKDKMQATQNNVIRYMLNVPPRTHIGPAEMKEVGLLPVEGRVKQLKLNHMFDIIHKRAPEYMNCQIDMAGSQHNRNTRASIMSCSVPRVKGKIARSSFFYTGISLWNNLPLHIKQSQTKAIFKTKVKAAMWGVLMGHS